MTQNIFLRVAIIDNIKFVIHNYYISVYKHRFIHYVSPASILSRSIFKIWIIFRGFRLLSKEGSDQRFIMTLSGFHSYDTTRVLLQLTLYARSALRLYIGPQKARRQMPPLPQC